MYFEFSSQPSHAQRSRSDPNEREGVGTIRDSDRDDPNTGIWDRWKCNKVELGPLADWYVRGLRNLEATGGYYLLQRPLSALWPRSYAT